MEEQIFEFKDKDGTIYYYSSYEEYSTIEKVVKNSKVKFKAKTKCWKCNGHKIILQFGHISEGICFECGGSGYQLTNLKVAKNKETIERRLKAKKNKQEEKENNFINNNLKKTLETYSEKFYIVLDTQDYSTYEQKEFLKSEKEAHWNSWFRRWWSKRNDIEGFDLLEINTREVLNDTNCLDSDKINKIICNYIQEKETSD